MAGEPAAAAQGAHRAGGARVDGLDSRGRQGLPPQVPRAAPPARHRPVPAQPQGLLAPDAPVRATRHACPDAAEHFPPPLRYRHGHIHAHAPAHA
eukprot:7319623-Prymnesium_polylepis.1